MDAKTDIYNSSFEKLTKLTWFPWIGSKYTKGINGKRLLLVGESHYAQDENGNFDPECYDDYMNDKNSTQKIIESNIDQKEERIIFKNTYKSLLGTEDINKEIFWSNVSYYNFIQRMMETREDRPTKADYSQGWNVFYELLKIIKPTHCLFLGSSCTEFLYRSLSQKENINITLEQWDEKIGRCYGKIAQINYEGTTTDLTFIRHPSAYFDWQAWNAYLKKKDSALLEELSELVVKK